MYLLFLHRKKDICDKEKSEYWMGAYVRTRMTFSESNPVVKRAMDLVVSFRNEIQTVKFKYI